jgi:ABC-type sugar transport system substrate-binding protein
MAAARLGVTNGTVLDQKCDILLIPDLVLGEGEAMRRREFIALIGAVACPLSARAQQTGVPIVGVLGTVAQPAWTKLVAAFEQQLRERGWIDGRTITIIYRWAEGRSERFAEIAAEFVSRKVDVIVTGGNSMPVIQRPKRSWRRFKQRRAR